MQPHIRGLVDPQIMPWTHGSLHLCWEHRRPGVSDLHAAHMWLLLRALRGIDLHYHLPSSRCLHLPERWGEGWTQSIKVRIEEDPEKKHPTAA